MMLDETDLLNLIRLNYLDLQKIYSELEANDEETRNNAGEMVRQTEQLARKLKHVYERLNPDYGEFPKYEDYIQLLKNPKPQSHSMHKNA
ncbi:MAG TPA: hypothetical protein VIM59_14940 [Cellvibrio sp.]